MYEREQVAIALENGMEQKYLNDCKWLGMNGLKCQLMSVPIMYNVCDASGLPTLLLLVAQWLCNCESNTHPEFGLFWLISIYAKLFMNKNYLPILPCPSPLSLWTSALLKEGVVLSDHMHDRHTNMWSVRARYRIPPSNLWTGIPVDDEGRNIHLNANGKHIRLLSSGSSRLSNNRNWVSQIPHFSFFCQICDKRQHSLGLAPFKQKNWNCLSLSAREWVYDGMRTDALLKSRVQIFTTFVCIGKASTSMTKTPPCMWQTTHRCQPVSVSTRLSLTFSMILFHDLT